MFVDPASKTPPTPTPDRPAELAATLRSAAERVLGRSLDAAALEDRSLLALGLDSLSAVELAQAIEDAVGVEVPLSSLLDGASLADLTAQVAGALAAGAPAQAAQAPAGAGPDQRDDSEMPLSYGQRALWFLQRLDPGTAANHIGIAARIDGDLDLPLLERLLQALVDRHPALRTTFHPRPDGPVQRVHRRLAAGFTVEDLPGLGLGLGGEPLARRCDEERTRPFDLESGPLLRVAVLRLSPRRHALILTAHHLVADFASLAILHTELSALYAASAAGDAAAGLQPRSPALPPAGRYADFVRWQTALVDGAAGERLWQASRDALAGPLPDLDLPTDRPRPAVRGDRGVLRGGRLDPRLAAGLRSLALAGDATLFTILQAAFALLLHRIGGQDDILVGTPVAGRALAEHAGVVGCFVNTLVLRAAPADFAGRPTFRQLLERLRRAARGARERQDFPFGLLVERLKPRRDPGRSPLVQALFTLQQGRRPDPQGLAVAALGLGGAEIPLGPLRLRTFADPHRPAQLDLALQMAPDGDSLAASLLGRGDLFDAVTVDRLLAHLRALLAAAVADPDRPATDLPLLAPAERHQTLVEWNATDSDRQAAAAGLHLDDLVTAQARRTPHRVALSMQGREALTYRALDRRSNQLARHLLRLGLRPEAPVGLYAERSPTAVAALLAVLKAGGAYLPLDPAYPRDRVRGMLDDSGARLVLTERRRAGDLVGYPGAVLCLDDDDLWAASEDPLPPAAGRRPAGPDALAYLIYTSGSTGRPKGVEVAHRGVVSFLASMAHAPGLGADDVLVAVTSLCFDIAALEIFLPLTVGARVALASRDTAADGFALKHTLSAEGATVLQATPATWRLLLAAGWGGDGGGDGRGDRSAERDGAHAPRLRVWCGGEALPADLAAQLLRRAAEVWNLYGPTETTIWSAAARLAPSGGPVTIGHPIDNTTIVVVDRAGQPLPAGIAGELRIGGHGVARGYHARPDLTAERFVPDPWSRHPGARLYRTGDLARRRRDGSLECLGRLDQQVKVRGFRIELGEIEAALRALPGVQEAVVLARAAAPGTSDTRLVAYLVPTAPNAPNAPNAAALAPAALRAALAATLPEAFLPSRFVLLERLPLTPNGKLDRRRLAADDADQPGGASLSATSNRADTSLAATSSLATSSLAATSSHAAAADIDADTIPGAAPADAGAPPQSGLEARIAAIWRQVLGVAAVGRDVSFFDLGGHSLLLAQVQTRLHEELGHELSMVDLFRHPTVAALAHHLAPPPPAAPDAAATGPTGPTSPTDRAARTDRAAPTGPTDRADRRVAIVGRAGRFPGAASVDQLWERLRAGEECITELGDEELRAAGVPAALLADPRYVRAAGILADADRFDAAFFGLSPREAELMDPQHRIFLEVAWAALEDAGYDTQRYAGRIGVYAGVGVNTYLHRTGLADLAGLGDLSRPGDLSQRYQAFLANDKDFVPTRASYKLNLTGPSIAVQTACSTSLVAIHLACQALLAGDCDMALAGAVAMRAPQGRGYLYEEGGIASPDGHCRAFAADAAGTVFGSGAGLVLLKRLDRALADGDSIHAVIRGTALNNDGARKIGYTAPSVEGQALVLADALAAAGVDPDDVTYVEAHGTGTPLGDPIELAALHQVFRRPAARRRQPCGLGSVKSNVGHLDTAAGICGLLKTVEALRHRELPPTLHCLQPNPKLGLDGGPFYINTELRPWPAGDTPRRAGVSSFGIGGTNAHVVLEEAPPAAVAPAAAPPSAAPPAELLLLSARTAAALDALTANLGSHLQAHPDLDLAAVAHTLRIGRRQLSHRRVVVCTHRDEAVAALTGASPHLVRTAALADAADGARPVAFLFPGQGAQHLRMGSGLYRTEPRFRADLDTCADLLRPHLGLDLRRALDPDFPRDPTAPTDPNDPNDPNASNASNEADDASAAAHLAETWLAQPALFAVEYALARLWQSWGVQPAAMLGHSLGEYVAACLAGVIPLADALALVALRGRLMQQLPTGAMLAVELPAAEVAALLAGDLSLAAVNGPADCTLSGPLPAIERLAAALAPRGVRLRRLHTSHAFHSAMMDPLLDPFVAAVARLPLRAPALPYVSNLTGRRITAAEATDPAYWGRHLRHTVQFDAGLATLREAPGTLLLEVGPGTALSSLARRSSGTAAVPSMRHPREAADDSTALRTAAGRLWLAGAALDGHAFAAGRPTPRRVSLPTYPFAGERHWLQAAPPAAVPATAPIEPRKLPNLADWTWVPLWKEMPPPAASPTPPAGPWLVLLHRGDTLAEGLARRLAAAHPGAVTTVQIGETAALDSLDQTGAAVSPGAIAEFAASSGLAGGTSAADGHPPTLTELGEGSFALDPRRPADYAALLATLSDHGQLPRVVVHAWNHGVPQAPADPRTLAFDSLIHLVQALERQNAAGAPKPLPPDGATGDTDADRRAPLRLAVLSSGLHAVAGSPSDPLLQPEKALLLGPVRVVPQEYPGILCRAIDLPPSPHPAAGDDPDDSNDSENAETAETAEDAELLDPLLAEIAADWAPAPSPATAARSAEPPASQIVALRAGQRFVRAFERRPLSASSASAVTSAATLTAVTSAAVRSAPSATVTSAPATVTSAASPPGTSPASAAVASMASPAVISTDAAKAAPSSAPSAAAPSTIAPAAPSMAPAAATPTASAAATPTASATATPIVSPAATSAAAGGAPPARIRQGGVYLITGGTGGIGLTLARTLAAAAPVKLVLTSRTPLPERSLWPAATGTALRALLLAITAIEEMGCEVLTLAADVADEAEMGAALELAERRFGPLTGVIHAAGVPGGGLVQLKTPAAADRVLAPKLRGTLVLDRLLSRRRQLDFFFLCSSLTAVAGGFGQSDYCAANAFCDAFARAAARRYARRGTLLLSIGWDRWEEVGMAAAPAPSATSPAPPAGGLDARPSSSTHNAETADSPDGTQPIATGHPLLGDRLAGSAAHALYSVRLSPERHWVLGEHSVAGTPTVPGATFLEMARAAFVDQAGAQPPGVEIQDVVFLSPLAVAWGAEREARTLLEPLADGTSTFRVLSRPADADPLTPWQEHARGRIAARPPGTPTAAPLATPSLAIPAPSTPLAHPATSSTLARDLAALLAACDADALDDATAPRLALGTLIETGPRWQSLRQLRYRRPQSTSAGTDANTAGSAGTGIGTGTSTGLGTSIGTSIGTGIDTSIGTGTGDSVAVLHLDDAFAADLAATPLHPALLDIATGALRLTLDDAYLPLAYQRLRFLAPMPSRCYSHVRPSTGLGAAPRDVITCDISILDEDGMPVVEIAGFSMKRVGAAALAHLRAAADARAAAHAAPADPAHPAHPAKGATVEPHAAPGSPTLGLPRPGDGIQPADGAEIFRRLLGLTPGSISHLVVATSGLPESIAAADAQARAALAGATAPIGAIGATPPAGATPPIGAAHARPDLSTTYAPPTDDLERQVAAAWQRVLGIDAIGLHDNFFELGGTSLSAIQLVSELRRDLRREISSVSLFEAPTVFALVAYLRHADNGAGELAERGRSRADKKRQALATQALPRPGRRLPPPPQRELDVR